MKNPETGEYRTPGGCSAWNGRTFGGARVDVKCNVGYIQFGKSGWYSAKDVGQDTMRFWFEEAEDPGCFWNRGASQSFKDKWGKISDEEMSASIWDLELNMVTLRFEPTNMRDPEDWFKPC